MKKLTAILILLAMLGTMVLTGCGGKDNVTENQTTASSKNGADSSENTPKETTEILTCKYLVPGDTPTELEEGLKLINEKLLEDGVGIKLERQHIAWDAWDQRINIILSTDEEFDLFHVMNDRTPVSTYVGRGALADITEYMDKYGENIKKVNPDIMMDACKVDGKLYAVPAFWTEFSRSPEISIRLDILKENNLPVPKSFEELTETFETVMKNWKGDQKPYIPITGSSSYKFGMDQKAYDSWPFWVYDNIFYFNQDTYEIKNYYETEEFKKDCENARLWYEKGLINPDVLVFTNEQQRAQLDSGNWFVHSGTFGNSIDTLKDSFPNITVDDFGFLNFFPEKPNIRPYGTRNMNAVPLNSKHPEVSVKFMNWFYANQENYDLYMYGREGVDYKKTGDRAREDIIDLASGRPLYYGDDWMTGNLFFSRIAGNSPKITNEMLYNIDETAIDSFAGTFVFDATSVKAELANVRTEISASIVPIANGVLKYDEAMPAALKKLKDAGIDRVVDEYKKQFEAFKAKTGK